MKDFCFTLANGSTTRITLDAHTHDALSHTCTRAWGETLDDFDRDGMTYSESHRDLTIIGLAHPRHCRYFICA